MHQMRVVARKQGGHWHCAVFTAPDKNQTFAKCGDLVFDEREWPDVLVTFECGGAEVIEAEPFCDGNSP